MGQVMFLESLLFRVFYEGFIEEEEEVCGLKSEKVACTRTWLEDMVERE